MANLSGTNLVGSLQENKQANTEQKDRQQRLNEALRENLVKRKQQHRSRQKQQIITKDSSAVKIEGVPD